MIKKNAESTENNWQDLQHRLQALDFAIKEILEISGEVPCTLTEEEQKIINDFALRQLETPSITVSETEKDIIKRIQNPADKAWKRHIQQSLKETSLNTKQIEVLYESATVTLKEEFEECSPNGIYPGEYDRALNHAFIDSIGKLRKSIRDAFAGIELCTEKCAELEDDLKSGQPTDETKQALQSKKQKIESWRFGLLEKLHGLEVVLTKTAEDYAIILNDGFITETVLPIYKDEVIPELHDMRVQLETMLGKKTPLLTEAFLTKGLERFHKPLPPNFKSIEPTTPNA